MRGILFDYSGTVVVSDEFSIEEGFRNVVRHTKIPSDQSEDKVVEFALGLELEFQRMRDMTALEFSFSSLLHLLLDLFRIETNYSIADLEAIYYRNAFKYRAAEGIKAFLEDAKKAKVNLGVISNSTHSGEMIGRQLAESGLGDYFSVVLSSADYGIRKQHPLLFEIGLSKIGLSKGEVVYVGDNLEYDIATAQTAGLRAIWYNKKQKPKTEVSPDYIFDSWLDVRYVDFDGKEER